GTPRPASPPPADADARSSGVHRALAPPSSCGARAEPLHRLTITSASGAFPVSMTLSDQDILTPWPSLLEIPAADDHDLPCRRAADIDLWFAERTDEVESAKALCGTCPIRVECLEGALARKEPWGVWGGEVFVD